MYIILWLSFLLFILSLSLPPSLSPSLSLPYPLGIKVVANAGGVNIEKCVETINKIASEEGVQVNVVAVMGDNMMPSVRHSNAIQSLLRLVHNRIAQYIDASE